MRDSEKTIPNKLDSPRKYQLIILASIIFFLYLLLSEVGGRTLDVVHLYREVGEKGAMMVDPGSLQHKYELLKRERQTLLGKWNASTESRTTPRSEAEVYEYLEVEAARHGITIISVEPIGRAEGQGEFQDVFFKIRAEGEYHAFGTLVLELEGGVVAIEMTSVVIKRLERPGTSRMLLDIIFEGRASIVGVL